MSRFFFRLISARPERSESGVAASPQHLVDLSRDAAKLDTRRAFTIVAGAATILLLGAGLGLEGCTPGDEGAPPMEFARGEATAFPQEMARCAATVPGNSDSQMLKRTCTEPRPSDPDFKAGASQ